MDSFSFSRRASRQSRTLFRARAALACAAALSCAAIWPSDALAAKGIAGAQVSQGSAKFERRGSKTFIQASDRTVINYSRFDILPGTSVIFQQPSASSRVLNRINSAQPTRIDGALSANGTVYLVNPAGVMFGPGSAVNVPKLYAAAGNLTDSNFLNNVDRFTLGGPVVNRGSVNGEVIALLGKTVDNYGAI